MNNPPFIINVLMKSWVEMEINTERLDNNDSSELNETAGKAGKNYNACSSVAITLH